MFLDVAINYRNSVYMLFLVLPVFTYIATGFCQLIVIVELLLQNINIKIKHF